MTVQPNLPPTGAKGQESRSATRGLVSKVIVAALFGAAVFLGLGLYSDLPKLRAAVMDFAPSAFLLALALAAANYGLRIARWQFYLRRLDIHIPLGESSLVFLSGFVMSVTPGKAGEVFKSLLLLDTRGISFARTAPIVVAERLTDLVALVILTAFGALAFPNGVLITGGGALVVGVMILVASHRGIGEWLLSVCDRLPLLGKVSARLREAHEALLALMHPSTMALSTVLAVVSWGLECVAMYVTVLGFHGAYLSLKASTFAYAASTIIGALAMMPGGLGVTEVGMAGLIQSLGNEGTTDAVAAATTILVRVATLWFAVVLGAVALGIHRIFYGARSKAGAAPSTDLEA